MLFADISSAAIKNVSLTVDPQLYVPRGQHATLRCTYDLDSKPLYSVKFYRGSREFYRYSPGELPTGKIFAFPGINVDVSKSNPTHRPIFHQHTHTNLWLVVMQPFGARHCVWLQLICTAFGAMKKSAPQMRRWSCAPHVLSICLRQILSSALLFRSEKYLFYVFFFRVLFLFLFCLALTSRVFHLIFHFALFSCLRFCWHIFVCCSRVFHLSFIPPRLQCIVSCARELPRSASFWIGLFPNFCSMPLPNDHIFCVCLMVP